MQDAAVVAEQDGLQDLQGNRLDMELGGGNRFILVKRDPEQQIPSADLVHLCSQTSPEMRKVEHE